MMMYWKERFQCSEEGVDPLYKGLILSWWLIILSIYHLHSNRQGMESIVLAQDHLFQGYSSHSEIGVYICQMFSNEFSSDDPQTQRNIETEDLLLDQVILIPFTSEPSI